MKRLIFALLTLLTASIFTQAEPQQRPVDHAQMLAWYAGGGEMQGFHVGGAAPNPTIQFLQCVDIDDPASATHTFTAQNVGTESGSRATIIGVTAEDSAAVFGISSVTVGGDSATEVNDEDGTGLVDSGIYILSNPTGTSEDVALTFSEAINSHIGICLWAVYDLSSLTAVASTVDDDTASAALVLNLSATTAAGVAVGICITQTTSATASWTGLTENTPESGANATQSSAHTSPTNGSALSITCDLSGTADASGASAAFR